MPLRLLVAVLLTLALPADLFAQAASPVRYRVARFTSEQGLPGHQVYDIEQTPDGYLWVATNNGLARFDGHRFAVFNAHNTPLPFDQSFTSLYLGPNDTLFTTTGRNVLSYADGDFRLYATPSLLMTLAKDRTGRLWGLGVDGLFYEKGGQFEHADSLVHGLRGRDQFFVDKAGEVWLLLKEGPSRAALPASSCRAGQAYQPYVARLVQGEPVLQAPTRYSYLVTYPARGELLVARVREGMVEFANPQGDVRGRFRLPDTACPLLMDREEYLWAKEGTALIAYAPGADEPRFRVDLGLSANFVPSTLEDREGNLWIGTFSQGLVSIRRPLFQVYATAQGIRHAVVVTIVQGADDSVLLNDRLHTLYRLDGERVIPLMDKVRGFYEDALGNLLYFRSEGTSQTLLRRIGEEERPLGKVSPGRGVQNYQIYPDPREAGVLWTHDYGSLFRLTDPMGETPVLTRVLDGLPGIRRLLKDQRGVLWIATTDGLYRFEDGRHTRFTTEDGLPLNSVRALHEDEDGILWVGTYGGGLSRYKDGRFQTVDESQGLAENIVSTILEDEYGYFWMSGDHGVHRAYRPDLNALLDGHLDRITSVLYGRESGLLNPEASGLPGLKADDGRLWFPTFEGAAVVDPEAVLRREQAPPIVHVQEVIVDNAPMDHRGSVRLRADQRRFEIAYVGLNLGNPNGIHYRYQLDGFDRDWVEAGTQRRTIYTNVSPGAYTFRVQARHATGSWSEQEAVLSLRIAPFFYETGWFYALCVLALLGLILGGYRVRIRRERALGRLVEERTEALAREKETVAMQAEALRALDEAKSHFFANISHEFRTPLTLILGPLEDVQEGLHGPVSDSSRQQVNTAIHNGRRLLHLVNQLLDVSRLESGKIDLQAQAHDMTAFVERLVQAFAPMAAHKRIAFRYESPGHPLPVYFDKEQFEKVLTNLLANAFKFTPEHGTVRVTLGTEEAEGRAGTMVLTVRDSGPGIAPEHLPHLFERFYQVDATSTRRQAGTGIGLALVKNLVDLHRGTVAVESEVGLGTTFTVRLPLGYAHLHAGEIVPPEDDTEVHGLDALLEEDRVGAVADLMEQAPQREASSVPATVASLEEDAPTVLVVDDNPEVRDYVRRHLAHHYQVVEAAEGREALQRARQSVPDLIISDVMMPELDGYGLCRAIRQDPDLNFIPIILLTAKASEDSKLSGLDEGADVYLTKPFNMRELMLRVNNLMTARLRLKQHLQATQPGSDGYNRPSDASTPEADFVAQVRQAIDAHLTDDSFGVDDLAGALHLSRSTLYRRLEEAASVAPMDLIWTIRLARAATLLAEDQGTVSEVAYGVGFKSVAHFSRRFQAAYGVSPSAYARRKA